MLHGRGTGNGGQYFLTKDYEKLRQKGLLDRTRLNDEEMDLADITTSGQGGGMTDPDKVYIFDNIPIPADRNARKVDRRTVPTYGLGEKKDE